MKDQVDGLCRRGVKAANLDSTLDVARSTWVKQEVLSGSMKLLYVAPERYEIILTWSSVFDSRIPIHWSQVEQREFYKHDESSEDFAASGGRGALHLSGTPCIHSVPYPSHATVFAVGRKFQAGVFENRSFCRGNGC